MVNRLNRLINKISVFVSHIAMGMFQLVLWAVNRIILIFIQLGRVVGKTVKVIMTYIPKIITKLIPKKTGNSMNQQLIYAGVEMTADEVISVTLVYSVVVAVIAYLIAIVLDAPQIITLIVVVAAGATVWILPLVLLSILTTNRTNAVEETLPDILSMVAQNMKAGMTSYNALWSAARPEFGPLAIEIQDVAKATLTGIPLTDALIGMTNHVRSTKLPRSIRLIIQGMKSGGDLPQVLQAITIDMRREQNLKKQMAAETSAHAIFIIFAIMIGAPLLFSVSFQFITIFSTMMTKLNVEDLSKNAPASMVTLSPMAITPDFFNFYAILILAISGFFAAMLVGILRTGNPISGIASTPAFVAIPIAVFYAMKFALGLVFSSMITF
jgi:Flp pilus assembly protein TadB